METESLNFIQSRLNGYAGFFGHCQALVELRGIQNIDDAWVARRLAELVVEYQGLLGLTKDARLETRVDQRPTL